MTELPRKAVTRTARLAALPLGVAGRAAWGLGKRVGGKPAEAVAEEMQARAAEQIFRTLGELKGGAMKFGQAMSIFEASLPEELAGPYRATLTRLQRAAPPMPAATVHQVLAEELGPRWRSNFADFDDRPVAAASIGQVHKAEWADGRPVAVKVQYPGAGDALVADLNQVARIGRLAGSWIPGLDIQPILAELRSRMTEELDYTLEAAQQQRFAHAFEGHEVFAVPHVVAFGERVLVSEWIEGLPLSTVIASGTREQRDLAATRYAEFLLAGPFEAGMLHADPHPGNFSILADGRFGVIDFGAVKHLPDGMPPEIGELLALTLAGKADDVVAGLRELGFIKETIDVDAAALLDYLEPFLAPARVSPFRFTRGWLRGLFTHVKDPRRPSWSIGLRINLPPEYLLLHRVWLGGIGVLCQLDGEVPVLDILDEWLPGFSRPAGPTAGPAEAGQAPAADEAPTGGAGSVPE